MINNFFAGWNHHDFTVLGKPNFPPRTGAGGEVRCDALWLWLGWWWTNPLCQRFGLRHGHVKLQCFDVPVWFRSAISGGCKLPPVLRSIWLWHPDLLSFFSVFSMFLPVGESLIFGLYWEHKGHFSWPFMTPWAPWSSQNRSKGGSSANLSSDMISSFNLTGSSTNLLANLGMSLKDRESLRRFANMSWPQWNTEFQR